MGKTKTPMFSKNMKNSEFRQVPGEKAVYKVQEGLLLY
jgi:hypothetical protein